MLFVPLGSKKKVAIGVRIFVKHYHGIAGMSQNQGFAGIFFLHFLTKDTAFCLGDLVDISHPPGSPELLHSEAVSSVPGSLPSTRSRSSLPTLKNGTRLAATDTKTPLFGFRPWRARRCFTTKLPKPRISIRSPCARASTMESKMALMITSESLRERCGNLLFTSSIKSRLVITSPSLHNKDSESMSGRCLLATGVERATIRSGANPAARWGNAFRWLQKTSSPTNAPPPD